MQAKRAATRAVLFDAAGTLIRLREPVGATYARFLAGQGAVVPAARLDEAFARVVRGMPAMVFPDADPAQTRLLERGWWHTLVRRTLRAADGSVRPRDFDACFDALFDHFASASAWEAMPGAAAALDALARRGLRLAVVSNFDHRLPGLLHGLGLDRRLERIVLPAEAHAVKPDPRMFAFALDALAIRADEAVYVGDDPVDDHAGAARAGLRAIDVRGLATLEVLPDLLAPDARA